MTSSQAIKSPKKSFPQSIPTQYAQLQAMGIELYSPLKERDIAQQSWLGDLCKLLDISKEDCVFESNQPFFDDKLKKLHLPKSTMVSEFDFKKLVWQNIRQFVN